MEVTVHAQDCTMCHATEAQITGRVIKEAIEALAQPIERCSLKHECRNDGTMTVKDIASGPQCYAAMVTDPAGDWVPYGHHKATAIGLASALGHIADLCSAIETQPPTVTNEFVENARKRAREFQESMTHNRKEL
jgi:hypothetical protein